MRNYCLMISVLLVAGCTSGISHEQLLTVDSHIDIPISLGTADADARSDGPMQVDIPKMREGGLDAGFFIVYVKQGALTDQAYKQAYQQALDKFAAIERMLTNSPNQMALVRNPSELKQTVKDGKLAVAIGVENAYPLGPNFEHLQEFYDRGARYISLTHFGHNHFGDSSVAKGTLEDTPEPINDGLSPIGIELIQRMNKLGIMVDVSHTSKDAVLAAISVSQTPVIASHSGVKALFDHPRNLSDEEIKAIAASGGVIQLVAFDSYMRSVSEEEKAAREKIREDLGLLGDDWHKHASQSQRGELRKRYQALNEQWPRATISTLVDHIDYVVKLVGIDYAGIASDFGGGGGVQSWDSIDQTPLLTEALQARGYTQADIQKIWSGNMLRVWSVVEAYGAKH